jgi:two-component system invasion response regulator UvrY
VADDDAGIRTTVSRLLSLSCDVVGSVSDSPTLFEVMPQLRPDVVLLDFSLRGGLSGLDVCRLIKTMTPEVNVVAFTAHDDAALRRAALEAGAAGFVSKLRAVTDLVSTIHAVVDRTGRSSQDTTA